MTDKETSASAKQAAKKESTTENLLGEFGASEKGAESSAKQKKAVTVKNAEAAPKDNASTGDKQEKKKNAEAKKTETAKETVKETKKKDKPMEEHAKKSKSSDGGEKKELLTASTADKKVRADKAPGEPSKKKEKKNGEVDLDNQPRSAKPAHQVIPYLLILLAVFVGVSLLLNLICNRGNVLEGDPASHLMGIVGYHICYWLFGLFGPAVFVLPVLILNLAIFWRRYVDHRIVLSKILAATVFLLALSTVIHVFCLPVLRVQGHSNVNLTVEQLLQTGARMTGGGLIGGKLGYLSYLYLNVIGSLIVGFALMALSLFYGLGMTLQHLWFNLRMHRAIRKRRAQSAGEQDAADAESRAMMDRKIRKVTKQEAADEEDDTSDDAAVVVKSAKKNPEDKLAPMPLPKLDPNDGSRPFVPVDVGRRINEEKKNATVGEQTARPTVPSTASATPTAQAAQASINPVQNRDAAVEPIFPRSNDQKQARKMPKEDRNFDLKNVFLDMDTSNGVQRRAHAPVPPEVPLGNKRPTQAGATQTQNASARPTAAQPRPKVTGSASAPSLSAVKPTPQRAGVEKPVFRQASNQGKKDFGLSNEEFEQLEAKQATPADGKQKKSAKAPAKAADLRGATPKKETEKKYVFPPISYLHPSEPMTEENRSEIQTHMNQLAATLASFNVRVQEINYSCGPTVTRYEVILAPGVRVRTITNLADDIALALRSSGGVRIEAPIPGTNAVGIEVPNKQRSTIYLRELIESKAFATSKSKLSACLGSDIAGDPIIFDIAKMPHLLIAGTTGSGKSVCINCIITSLLYKVRPDEIKLVLIDPKKVEFSIYKNIPHLMAPVVTTPKDAAGALQAAVEEMERRFEVFESIGVRDLKGYNEITKDDPDMPFIPNIVIIIDELADLMMTAKNEVETAICRIAQKARAAGMHLIIGTQRPSVDVVTGLIKANVPSSIAFAVKSQMDSRVILDHGGAEALLGRGDMLFVPIGSMRDTRIQGAFVDDKEVEQICEFIRATNGTAQYDEKFISKLKELAAQCGSKGKSASADDLPSGPDDKGNDPKYTDAVRIAIEEKRVSTSLLQRKLEVGYSRAAKLIDRMQSEGIVSPPDGSKPRAILITAEEFMDRFMMNEGEEEK